MKLVLALVSAICISFERRIAGREHELVDQRKKYNKKVDNLGRTGQCRRESAPKVHFRSLLFTSV